MTLKSWIPSANKADSDFPVQNLPYGVFRHEQRSAIGVAIGDSILDLRACATEGHLTALSAEIIDACKGGVLNPLMSLGATQWSALRRHVTLLLEAGQAAATKSRLERCLVSRDDAVMQLPCAIGDYTDFYASIHHATRVGKLFRPDKPLLPNYKYVPIGYHGRASSIVISGTGIRRPWGQVNPTNTVPSFRPAGSLDYELEIGILVGPGNPLGEAIDIAKAEQHIFGFCLLNDWSARDIQTWEYQPLGPFLSKSFATTISPWIVPFEALAPYRVPAAERPDSDPAPLDYLTSSTSSRDGINLTLSAYLQSSEMRRTGIAPFQLSSSNLRDLYWTPLQLLAHHASNGCNLRPGDLLATGTISGSDAGSEGCLLERRSSPEPLRLPSRELRTFLEDGDKVILRACAESPGLPRIGFGECSGTICPAAT